MATNISKYVQLNDFFLLEYEFNKDAVTTPLTIPYVVDSFLGTKYFFEDDGALGITNNILPLNSVPTNTQRTAWFFDSSSYGTTYWNYLDFTSLTNITTPAYACDTVKVHIVSGYNFDDIAGFLLQIRAFDGSTGSLVDLANFTYVKQPQTLGSNVVKFSTNTLFLGNRFYDKYVEFKVPSIQTLGGDITASPAIGGALHITALSDVYVTYSTIFEIISDSLTPWKGQYTVDEIVNFQLPVTSVADNFNCFIAESTAGDYIEYYATWSGLIIGNYMGDIESGKIKLYTSNNPNDSYNEFVNAYGMNAAKWVIIHEISVYEQLAGLNNTTLLTQKYSFTQDSNFSDPNYFRPILVNADIDAAYSIQYTCRLMNRMDGTQIIRKASFSSVDPKKYGLLFTRLTVENLIPYKVFNKVAGEKPNLNIGSGLEKIKYVKVFYDTTNILLNAFNEVFPDGTGPLFLKSYDSTYLFKFEKLDTNNNRINVDLSGAYNYALLFKFDDGSKLQVGPTYSTNMNTTLGEIEFKLSEGQLATIKSQTNNNYAIIILNPNGTSYTFYQGSWFDITNQQQVIANYNSLFSVTDLQTQVSTLQAQVNALTSENAALKTK
jgi:hypothetical protein